MVFVVLGRESQTSPAEVSDGIPFWAAFVCSCSKKTKHLIPRINLLGSWGHAANDGDTRQWATRALEDPTD